MSRKQNFLQQALAASFFLGALPGTPLEAKPAVIEGAHCEFETVTIDGTFEGGRLSACREQRKGDYILEIRPEGTPINPSPWFAFDITSTDKRKITVTLDYGDYRHRYSPDIWTAEEGWRQFSGKIRLKDKGALATFKLDLGKARKVRLAGQPLIVREDSERWMRALADADEGVDYELLGQSQQGRPIHFLETGAGLSDWVLVIGRQHPPETTGAIAMQAFVERLMAHDALAEAFRAKVGLLIVPMLNPDGVAAGNWRFESSGKDMNRDWGPFEKHEPQLVRDKIERRRASGKRLIAGLDFHSTKKDVLYTQPDDDTEYGWFAKAWHGAINARIEAETPGATPMARDAGHNAGYPNFKTWTNITYGAPGITVEFGDETDPERLRQIGRIAAEEMMRLLAPAE